MDDVTDTVNMGRHDAASAADLPMPAPRATWGGGTGDEQSTGVPARTWLDELSRWLATLNPGRTRREYEKAVRYFFDTPGVPQHLRSLSFDLLLAYRGALALRATTRGQVQRGTSAERQRERAALATPRRRALPEQRGYEDREPADQTATTDEQEAHGSVPGPLAPATVNIRLTALRQFLTHCALMGELPDLPPERVRAALRRLSIERRRPYQVLAEPEWEGFLRAARLEDLDAARVRHRAQGTEQGTASDAAPARPRGIWGVPRARRPRATQTDVPARAEPRSRLPRSRAGLTGERTAQRDHALIALALATGLRAIELSELDVGDLTREWHAGREEWWLVLPDIKTKGQHGGRTLPLAQSLVETLLAYVRMTGRRWELASDRATPLFLSGPQRITELPASGDTTRDAAHTSGRARRLSPGHIGRIVDRVETQWITSRGGPGGGAGDELVAGETRVISPHALRHSTAVALLEGSDATGRPPASVEHVRGWLGHFDIRTTQGYLAHLEARRHRRPFALSPVPDPQPETTESPNTAQDVGDESKPS